MDALRHLAPVSDRYAALPVAEAFTWSACAAAIEPGDYYLVAFRSVRAPTADESRLTAYDDLAHAEAARSAGFIHYFKGPTTGDGSCLSFCLWRSRHDARRAAGMAAHVRAAQLVHEMYAAYRLEFLRLRKATVGAPLEFGPYDAPIAPEDAAAA